MQSAMRIALALLGCSLVLACVSTLAPTPADRDAAITREDFADWMVEYALETRRESLSKAARKGIVIVESDWLGDDGELAVSLHSTVYWTRTPAEAQAAFRAMLAGAGRGKHGIDWRPAFTHAGWAEGAKAYLLVRHREVIGNLYFGHRENVAVMVMLTGLYTSRSREFERKLEPMLWQLTRHAAQSAAAE